MGVLLFVSAETLAIAADGLLEVDGSDRLVVAGPEGFDKFRKFDRDFSASFRFFVDLLSDGLKLFTAVSYFVIR